MLTLRSSSRKQKVPSVSLFMEISPAKLTRFLLFLNIFVHRSALCLPLEESENENLGTVNRNSPLEYEIVMTPENLQYPSSEMAKMREGSDEMFLNRENVQKNLRDPNIAQDQMESNKLEGLNQDESNILSMGGKYNQDSTDAGQFYHFLGNITDFEKLNNFSVMSIEEDNNTDSEESVITYPSWDNNTSEAGSVARIQRSNPDLDNNNFTEYNVGVLMASHLDSPFDLERCGPAVDMALEEINERFLASHKVRLQKHQGR